VAEEREERRERGREIDRIERERDHATRGCALSL
jgi:hypothetical protein